MIYTMTTAQNSVKSLASAFWGYSQIPNAVVGAAVFGRANNASSPWSEEEASRTVADCATVIDLHFDL